MIKDSKGKCESSSHKLLKEKAKTRVDYLQAFLTNLKSATKESRTDDNATLEEVNKMLQEWKAELNEPSPASSLLADSLGSFSEELARLLRTDEEDDATSPLKELLPTKPESDLQNLHLGNLVQFTEDFYVSPEPQETFQEFYQCGDTASGFQNLMVDNSGFDHHFDFHQYVNEGPFIGGNDVKQPEEDAAPSVLPVISPTEPSFLGPTCALWDCSRPAECGKDYCCNFHATSALEEGQPGKSPVFRPRGISLKDNALFDALIAWNQGKAVGIPNCEGAATLKSPWNDSKLFNLSFLEGETVREWLFFDKPRRAFGTGNRRQRSLPDHSGRGWHESRKQIMKEFDGQKRSYYMDPQPSIDQDWHLFEYEVNNSDACALYRLELKFGSVKKSPKGKVSNEVADLQKKMGKLTAEVATDGANNAKGKTKKKADAGNIFSSQSPMTSTP
ncbi:putative transcription factor VOZ family [Rosa chinensis]|uniref:Putative transcription factor VOZ family n=1 Tax=Rosa chinensis TaxID=74649 RepID=A0A2P6RUC9_ROSCH|nr:transcription factor VOZ1 [Rosa chinensis]XP_024177726.1 transcription factor VOZ1 [Rosa chinensis]XP_024177727.1 transcription factor VOZ1 [Rosa chinensis]PRQ50002.1 putative transcription factor VOZ family [Rosa chinensis]